VPLYIGHATVTWASGDVRLWADPFLRPRRRTYPACYQPLGPADFPETEAVVMITHSHPDHFDPASLFLFPEETRFLIPVTGAESPLTLDVALRLRQLGFERIEPMAWGESIEIGGFEIIALPFYGEQPLGFGASAVLPAWNMGNSWLVRFEGDRGSLLLADCGGDPRSAPETAARAVRKAHGRIGTVFGNHRRWRVHPPQYLTSSVPHYLCCVPDQELEVEQAIMLDPLQLGRVAEILGARTVVPYAMGGAPWFTEIGLGVDYLSRRPQAAMRPTRDERRRFEDHGPDGGLVANVSTAILLPGQQLVAGQAVWPAGRDPGETARLRQKFRRHRQAEAWHVLDVEGRAVNAALVRDLLALTSLDERATIACMPEFCEVSTTPGRGGELLRATTSALVAPVAGLTVRLGRQSLVGKPFCGKPPWDGRMRSLHHRITVTLREGRSLADALGNLGAEGSFARVDGPVIEAVAAGLLSLDLAGRVRRARGEGPRKDATPPPLDRAAASVAAAFGATATAWAQLLVRALHDGWLLSCLIGQPPAEDERTWFLSVLE
jgi:L-ascorbate metabolism protein UlaG (beta-lactamase superfamily)